MNFDSLFFLAFGIFSLIMGVLNRGGLFWFSMYDGLKKVLGKDYNRVTNIIWGIISILIGLALFKR